MRVRVIYCNVLDLKQIYTVILHINLYSYSHTHVHPKVFYVPFLDRMTRHMFSGIHDLNCIKVQEKQLNFNLTKMFTVLFSQA